MCLSVSSVLEGREGGGGCRVFTSGGSVEGEEGGGGERVGGVRVGGEGMGQSFTELCAVIMSDSEIDSGR